MHLNSLLLYRRYAVPKVKAGMRVLEIGPDGFPSTYQRAVSEPGVRWDTLDIQDDQRLTYSAVREYSFPIGDETYDAVVSGQVIEHVRALWRWLPEVVRVTKKGGLVIIINPVSWPYHEAPIDCWRIYPDGMRALCEDAGLEIETCLYASLERPGYREYIPGRSPECQSWPYRMVGSILGMCGYPVERAYDTITVGRRSA